MNNKYQLITFLLLLSLASCKQRSNDKLDEKLTKEFNNSINEKNAKKFEFNYDGLVPQESYFVDGKIKYLKFKQNPEAGFSEGKIIFNSKTDSIERYILRIVSPEWKTYHNDIFDKYSDTIYIIFPTENKTFAYSKNKFVDSMFRPYINQWNVEFISEIKHETEKEYNSR